ncbi:MAG: hypothetical protein L3J95_01615 [Thermoplasmata archaeon]|nr:hypothetical protein [Thermoplasmata archaeon]MCI4359111.1 hypothetical protein [Thermoplasmata archaeon]
MLVLYLPALLVAFVITIVEMTEVVAVVFALGADRQSVGHGAAGAAAGTTVVGTVAIGFSALLIALPRSELLGGAAVVLFGFGVFLFRSTLRSYRRHRANPHPPPAGGDSTSGGRVLQFGGGFVVGAVEATETVIVLLALAAAGYGPSAVFGAVAGGVTLVGAAIAVHQQIRRIKVPTLKLGATSMVFTFAVFWGGEAESVKWPGSDLFLLVIFVAAVLVVRGLVEVLLRPPVRVEANG